MVCAGSAKYTTASLIFNREKMEKALYLGFSNATEIADSLVIEGNLSFREAHKIVGGAISELFQQGKGQEYLNYELLNAWSMKVTGKPLPMSEERVEKAKDFREGVERRNCLGATSQKEIARMLSKQKNQADQLAITLEQTRANWKGADDELHRHSQAIIKGLSSENICEVTWVRIERCSRFCTRSKAAETIL